MKTPEEYQKEFQAIINERTRKSEEITRKYADNPYSEKAEREFLKNRTEAKKKYDKLREEFLRDYPNGLPEEYKKKN